MYGYTSLEKVGGGGKGEEVDLEQGGGGGTLYPGLSHGENQLRWGFVRKVYGILTAQILLTTVVSFAAVLSPPTVTYLLRGNSPLLFFLTFLPFLSSAMFHYKLLFWSLPPFYSIIVPSMDYTFGIKHGRFLTLRLELVYGMEKPTYIRFIVSNAKFGSVIGKG